MEERGREGREEDEGRREGGREVHVGRERRKEGER